MLKKVLTNYDGMDVTACYEEQPLPGQGNLVSRELVSLTCEPFDREDMVGRIVIGRVANVTPSIGAAYIEYEPGEKGFFDYKKNPMPLVTSRQSSAHLSSDGLFAGDEVVIQIDREAARGKIPVLTSCYSLTEKYLVLTRGNTRISVSSKIRDKVWSEAAKEALAGFANDEFGFIIRTAANGLAPEILAGEAEKMIAQYREMLAKASYMKAYAVLHQPIPSYLAAIRDRSEEFQVRTDLPSVYEKIASYCREKEPEFLANVSFYEDSYPLTKVYSLAKEFEEHTAKRMWLKSGGFLTFEQTEALYVIDVNTGKGSKAKGNAEDTYLRMNLEAAEFIARELRIRNISGMILVDCIDMREESHKEELLTAFRRLTKTDPVYTDVLDMTRLGIVEMTRKKVKKSLDEQIRNYKKELDIPFV